MKQSAKHLNMSTVEAERTATDSRDNTLLFETSLHNLTAEFIVERLERLSLSLTEETVIVLDNAKIHTAKAVQERRPIWEQRGLTLFYLPPYSPHLNLAEVLCRKLKYEWLRPQLPLL